MTDILPNPRDIHLESLHLTGGCFTPGGQYIRQEVDAVEVVAGSMVSPNRRYIRAGSGALPHVSLDRSVGVV
jgi:hypothetical protein